MRVALFIPCFMDQFYPRAAMATLELLEKLGCEVDYPEAQTCCGQPMTNSGCVEEAKACAEHYCDVFADAEYVVSPSGSCTSMVRNHYPEFYGDAPAMLRASKQVYELCEFLTDVLKVEKLDATCKAKVGFHSACHGLRELRLGQSSERVCAKSFSKPLQLLRMVQGITLTELERTDECCGFGGTFAVSEEAVSVMMGKMRVEDHLRVGTEILTSTDSSCLMHLAGFIGREKVPMRIAHIAEILNGDFA